MISPFLKNLWAKLTTPPQTEIPLLISHEPRIHLILFFKQGDSFFFFDKSLENASNISSQEEGIGYSEFSPPVIWNAPHSIESQRDAATDLLQKSFGIQTPEVQGSLHSFSLYPLNQSTFQILFVELSEKVDPELSWGMRPISFQRVLMLRESNFYFELLAKVLELKDFKK